MKPLRSLYHRHRKLLWTTLALFLLYLLFLPVYAFFLNAFYTYVLNRTGPGPLSPSPWNAPRLPPILAALLGHLRFAFFLVLPLALPALPLLLHTRLTRRPHPSARALLYTALLALVYYYLPGLPYPSVHVSGDRSSLTPTVTKPVTLVGARLATPDLRTTLDVAPGAPRMFLPALITLRSLPLTAPGPVPPEATLIAAAEVWRLNPFSDNFANFFNRPAPLRLSLRRAVAPARNSTHYTEVCSWIGEEGNGFGLKNYWHCHLSSLGPGTERKGGGYIEVELAGLGGMHQNYYVFQFPKAWADRNCVEAGGILYNEVDFHSFGGACRGRPGGTVAQIGQLKAPETSFPLPEPQPAAPNPP